MFFFQFEVIINVVVSYLRFILIPMVWVYSGLRPLFVYLFTRSFVHLLISIFSKAMVAENEMK